LEWTRKKRFRNQKKKRPPERPYVGRSCNERGNVNDFIEPKIRPLVEVLNSWDGFRTFSSCDGHKNDPMRDIPHVAFTCDDNELLADISGRLFKTSWKITLTDKSASIGRSEEDGTKVYGLHYTLRPIPDLSGATLEDLQAEIPEIAKKLLKSNKTQDIKNNFPVLQCPDCENESFRISGFMDFDLEYSQARIPELLFDFETNVDIVCNECAEVFEVDDPAFLFSKILSKAKIY